MKENSYPMRCWVKIVFYILHYATLFRLKNPLFYSTVYDLVLFYRFLKRKTVIEIKWYRSKRGSNGTQQSVNVYRTRFQEITNLYSLLTTEIN